MRKRVFNLLKLPVRAAQNRDIAERARRALITAGALRLHFGQRLAHDILTAEHQFSSSSKSITAAR